ncbi:hypothetical protein HHL16_23665 [Pseudoflavitalea sp. G-6-1-2]|uniref:hypothetical protein n=1 Tax=Pseudoflavitalea sp. G-6-1-2 TaxID=2728841 RepID=UPI00146B4733|nr:hypothetical protein [Pseudoflavitalea sp. G-6-1-2]NML23899.1 hypothetical protein [Pseudoflavitalea sp. G-6-1-2]
MERKTLAQLTEEFRKHVMVYPASQKRVKGPLFPEEHARVEEMLSKVVNWPPELQPKKP